MHDKPTPFSWVNLVKRSAPQGRFRRTDIPAACRRVDIGEVIYRLHVAMSISASQFTGCVLPCTFRWSGLPAACRRVDTASLIYRLRVAVCISVRWCTARTSVCRQEENSRSRRVFKWSAHGTTFIFSVFPRFPYPNRVQRSKIGGSGEISSLSFIVVIKISFLTRFYGSVFADIIYFIL